MGEALLLFIAWAACMSFPVGQWHVGYTLDGRFRPGFTRIGQPAWFWTTIAVQGLAITAGMVGLAVMLNSER